ncbi:hypothetical protein DB41_HY00350 [Neochlamydia sp. TUME1]|nr:hypothetical protein DB41_HY00350 [Neochlamydia sp. TUME1]
MLEILMLRKQCKSGSVVNRKNSYLQAFFVLQMPVESRLKLGLSCDRLQKKPTDYLSRPWLMKLCKEGLRIVPWSFFQI